MSAHYCTNCPTCHGHCPVCIKCPQEREKCANCTTLDSSLARVTAERDALQQEVFRYANNPCGDRNHIGLEKVMLGARLPNPELGQNAAFIASLLGKLEADLAACREALTALLNRYVGLVNSGDAGFWNPEEEVEVQQARAALRPTREAGVPLTRPPERDA